MYRISAQSVADLLGLAFLALVLGGTIAQAQPRIVPSCDSNAVGRVGPITGRPLPRFESVRASEANFRRGPSFDHEVDGVIRLPGLPVCVISEIDGWRRIELPGGERGWLSAPLLSERRFVLFAAAPGPLYATPDAQRPVAEAPPLAPLRLQGCDAQRCAVSLDGAEDETIFYVERAEVWGVRPVEETN